MPGPDATAGGDGGGGASTKPLNFFAELPTTIFTVMSELAAKHGAINLGQACARARARGDAGTRACGGDDDDDVRVRRDAAAGMPGVRGRVTCVCVSLQACRAGRD